MENASTIVNTIWAVATTIGVFVGGWAFVRILKEIKHDNDEEVKKRQRWDNAADILEKKAETWDKGLADVYNERNKIVEKYDDRLDTMEAQIQQLFSMVVLLIKSENVLLEEQIQKGSNDRVKAMHGELNDYIVKQLGQ